MYSSTPIQVKYLARSKAKRRAVGSACAFAGVLLMAVGAGAAAPAGLGTSEFGLSERELIQAIEQAETSISRCMREQGFQYVAADYTTIIAGMKADKKMPGL